MPKDVGYVKGGKVKTKPKVKPKAKPVKKKKK